MKVRAGLREGVPVAWGRETAVRRMDSTGSPPAVTKWLQGPPSALYLELFRACRNKYVRSAYMTSENSVSRPCEMPPTLVLIMGWDTKGNTVPRARCQERYSAGGV